MVRTKQNLNITVDKEAFNEVKEYLDKNLTNTSKYFNFIMLEDLKILKISKQYKLKREDVIKVLCWLRTYLDMYDKSLFNAIKNTYNLTDKQIDDIHSIWVNYEEEDEDDDILEN